MWLGTQQPVVSSELNVYPNPTEGLVFINSAPDGEVTIVNSVGEIIRTETISGNQTRLDITDQPEGLYLVSLQMETGAITRKIIKM
jgi:sugar/nucleoside kinase (ribokinase family)